MAVQEMSDDKSTTWETGSGHTLRVGDFVYLIPKDPTVDLYIAKIDKMYRDEKGKRWIQTRWYYRPGDLRHEPPSKPFRNEVYYTNYFDCNEVESVARHCKVFTKSEYFDERRRSSTEMSYDDIYFYEYCYSDETGSFAKISVSDPHIRQGFRKKTVTPSKPKDVSLKVLIDALVDLEETLPRDSLAACLKEKRLDWLTRVKESKTVNNITQLLLVFEDFLQLNTKNECNYLSEWRKALTANSSPESILQNIQHLKDYVLLRHGSTPKKRKRCSSETINTSDQGKDKLPLLQEADELANESDKIGAAIKEGGIYEIDHKSLPPKYPIHLKSIRAVLVTEKTKVNVSVSFPSNLALRKYFGKEFCEGAAKNVSQSPQARQLTRIGPHPELDEQFVMGPRMAERVLVRQIHPSEYVHERHLESFWLINSKQIVIAAADVPPRTQVKVPEPASMSADNTRPEDGGKDATVMSDVEVEKVLPITWGLRRKVMFNRKHRSWTEKEDEQIFTENDSPEIRGRPGQKRQRQAADDAIVAFGITGEKSSILKLPKEMQGRWTSERYRTAQLRLLDIMHEKGAVPGRPILRPTLREEARKHIGDTGLLDHLLKHMTDTVVTNGERFRRRHNADGAMEYWLEEAGLMEIRKQAGIEDPSWIPPPGWKPGDKLLLNGYGAGMTPLEAAEMKTLKEDISKLKSELVSLKNINVTETKRNDPAEDGGILKEELKDIGIEITSLRMELQNKSLEITSLRKELSELQNKSLGESNQMLPKTELLNKETKQTNQSESQDEKPIQAGTSMSRCNILDRIEKLETEKNKFVQEMESKYSAEKQHFENQFSKLSEAVQRIQDKMNAVMKSVAESKDSSLAATQNAIKEPSPEQSPTNPSERSMNMPISTEENVENGEPSRMKSENTACKGQQRPARTGFRVCKPEGTFLWPNAAPKMSTITTSSTSSRVLSQEPEYFSLKAMAKDVNAISSTVNKDFSVSAGISSAVAVYKSLSEAEMCPRPANGTFSTQLSLSPDSRSGQKPLLQPSPCGRQKELISMYANHLTTPRVPWAQASGQIALARPPLMGNHILPPVLPQPSWLGLAPPVSSSARHDTYKTQRD